MKSKFCEVKIDKFNKHMGSSYITSAALKHSFHT